MHAQQSLMRHGTSKEGPTIVSVVKGCLCAKKRRQGSTTGGGTMVNPNWCPSEKKANQTKQRCKQSTGRRKGPTTPDPHMVEEGVL